MGAAMFCSVSQESWRRGNVRRFHLVLIGSILLSGGLTLQAQSYPESLICAADLRVGEIPGSPFMADIVVQQRHILHDGSLGTLISSQTVGFAVRNSHGKVAVRVSDAYKDAHGKVVKWDAGPWHEAICDPKTKTRVNLYQPEGYSHHFATVHSQMNSHGDPEAGTTNLLRSSHKVVPGRVNLGEEMFDNLPAYRYYVAKSSPPRTLEHMNSDAIAAELLHGILYSDPPIAVETLMTNLRQVEPPRERFTLPAWAETQANPSPPIAPPWMMPGGQPGGVP
jgi:hypothetical protein